MHSGLGIGRTGRIARRAPVAFVLFVILLALLASAFEDWTATCDLDVALAAPSLAAPFGRDLQGCDYLVRTLVGAAPSIVVPALATLLALSLGVTLGAIAALFARGADPVVLFLADTLSAVPLILGAVAVLGIGEAGTLSFVLILGIFSCPIFLRISRASTLSVIGKDYVLAASALGCRKSRILVRHVAPEVLEQVSDYLPLHMGLLVGAEATLSFLGVERTVSRAAWSTTWGSQIAEGLPYVAFYPHLVVVPATAIGIVVVTLSTLSGNLRWGWRP